MSFAASRWKTKYQTPHKGGRAGAVAAFGLLLPPASSPRLGRSSAGGMLPPDPLGFAPCVPFGTRAPLRVDQARGGWAQGGWATLALSTLRSNPLFNTKRKIFKNVGQAKRVRPGGRPPVGKGGGRCGVVGSFAVHKSMPTPLCPSGRTSMAVVLPLKARRRRSAVSFQMRVRA